MAVTTHWSPNQAAIAQVETYTFTAPSSAGNTYTFTINGKSITYTSVSGDTATTVATELFNLLNVTTGIAAEFTEITWANPSAGVITATAQTPGVPFANITINGVSGQGLVASTGNGLANGITTTHTTANASPSDVNDPQNWLRTDLATTPPNQTRAIPQTGDDVVVSDSSVPMLWNLDRLAAVQFNTYERKQSMTGAIGLPDTNALGYSEWRARDFKFVGPQGSTPAGGLIMLLGTGVGSGPSLERYNVGSQKATVRALAGNTIRFLGAHTDNTITVLGGVNLLVASQPGEIARLNTVTVDGGATVTIGSGVTWSTSSASVASSMTTYGGTIVMGAAPATLTMNNATQATFDIDGLTYTTITARGNCNLNWLCGGTITTLTMEVGCVLDKSADLRTLTITNSTIDGDSCQFIDPLNAIVWTNATSVKQQVNTGPFTFTGTRTVKVT